MIMNSLACSESMSYDSNEGLQFVFKEMQYTRDLKFLLCEIAKQNLTWQNNSLDIRYMGPTEKNMKYFRYE